MIFTVKFIFRDVWIWCKINLSHLSMDVLQENALHFYVQFVHSVKSIFRKLLRSLWIYIFLKEDEWRDITLHAKNWKLVLYSGMKRIPWVIKYECWNFIHLYLSRIFQFELVKFGMLSERYPTFKQVPEREPGMGGIDPPCFYYYYYLTKI